MSDDTPVKLLLNWYEIEGNSLIGEEVIQNMTTSDILNLFEAPFWNRIYHCWAVDKSHIETIQKNVSHKINTKKYSYFLEVYKVS